MVLTLPDAVNCGWTGRCSIYQRYSPVSALMDLVCLNLSAISTFKLVSVRKWQTVLNASSRMSTIATSALTGVVGEE